ERADRRVPGRDGGGLPHVERAHGLQSPLHYGPGDPRADARGGARRGRLRAGGRCVLRGGVAAAAAAQARALDRSARSCEERSSHARPAAPVASALAAVAARSRPVASLLRSTRSAIPETQRARREALFRDPAHVRGTLRFMAATDLD